MALPKLVPRAPRRAAAPAHAAHERCSSSLSFKLIFVSVVHHHHCRPVLALADAVKAVKLKARVTKTVESVDICVALGIDPKRSDQAARALSA